MATLTPADVIILGFPPGELNTVTATTGLVDALRGKLLVSLLAGGRLLRPIGALLALGLEVRTGLSWMACAPDHWSRDQ